MYQLILSHYKDAVCTLDGKNSNTTFMKITGCQINHTKEEEEEKEKEKQEYVS